MASMLLMKLLSAREEIKREQIAVGLRSSFQEAWHAHISALVFALYRLLARGAFRIGALPAGLAFAAAVQTGWNRMPWSI
jgi:hypothetical protein